MNPRRPLKKLLVANRGEPVMRAVRTARRLGLAIGVVYAPDDAGQEWIRHVDFALPLTLRTPGSTPYVDGEQIVALAARHHCDALWPAWGFLAEDPDFAQMVIDAGVRWIGPHPDAIRRLGSKVESSRIAAHANVPTIPEVAMTVEPHLPSPEALRDIAERIGYPLLLKPALGGGGQGQLVVRAHAELTAAFDSVARINRAQFHNGPILVQRLIEQARHIEAQVLADGQGSIVIFQERDCSIQRRNQKIIEESPSPGFPVASRQALQDAARRLAQHVGYTSAGTLEFLFDGAQLYFLEMNTRLQVEHPVTEATHQWTDHAGTRHAIDLLDEMLRVAAGESLRFTQTQLVAHGHAIEARLYAEDPLQNFQPSPGLVTALALPHGDDVRIDTALLGTHGAVNPHYDPMVAKLIAWGPDRDAAVGKLAGALSRTTIAGIPTNIPFLQAVLREPHFQQGRYTTQYLAEHPQTVAGIGANRGDALLVAALASYERDRRAAMEQMMSGRVTNAAAVLAAVPANGATLRFLFQDRPCDVRVAEWAPQQYLVWFGATLVTCTMSPSEGPAQHLILADGRVIAATTTWNEARITVLVAGESYTLHRAEVGAVCRVDPHAAPGGGRITKIAVTPGARVSAGDALYSLEAMKMESQICAAHDGVVVAIDISEGSAVQAGQAVVAVERLADPTVSEDVQPWLAEELGITPDTSPTAQFFTPALACGNHASVLGIAQDIILRFVQGYDVTIGEATAAAQCLLQTLREQPQRQPDIARWLASVVDLYHTLQRLLTEEHSHAAIYFVEHLRRAERPIPRATEALLIDALRTYGVSDLHPCVALEFAALHVLQATVRQRSARQEFLRTLVQTLTVDGQCQSRELETSLVHLFQSPVIREQEQQLELWRALALAIDPAILHAAETPMVAPEYAAHYSAVVRDPLSLLSRDEQSRLPRTLDAQRLHAEPFGNLPQPLGAYLARVFAGAPGAELPVTDAAQHHGVALFVIQEPKAPSRYRLVATLHLPSLELHAQTASLPQFEQAMIAAFNLIRIYQALGLPVQQNHFFVQIAQPIPISGGLVKQISRRIAGFARDIGVSATEILSLVHGDYHIFEVWHARSLGLLARPPCVLADRKPEWDATVEADNRQRRLGKLLNADRMRLLFDDAGYEELFFPEVDDVDDEPIGLTVYRGPIGGVTSLVYAGDFRFRGGALGEREGKKLAATVVLAYALQTPLLGVHDGAGANIKGSVASLGWAGAYFGAIAATGGHSSAAQFHRWLHGHCERPFFEKILAHFQAHVEPRTANLEPSIHLHLHLGASVGMLVYGPSISSCAVMVDHPEVYRLLTGAATVERVTGERGSNYDLGGVLVHGRLSGEIDVVLGDEQSAIAKARDLLAAFVLRDRVPSTTVIHRSVECPQPTIPISGGVIVGRDAIHANVDDGEFFEVRRDLAQAGALLTGYARLGGQPVALAVTATDYGLHHGRAFKKAQLIAAGAEDLGLPLIVVAGANWDRLEPPVRTETIYQLHEMRRAMRTARIPKIGVIMGPRALERDIHEMMDLRCYVPRGNESAYELSRAHLLCHAVVDTLAAAFDWCADIVQYLPRPWELGTTTGRMISTTDRVDRSTDDIARLLPPQLTQPYDVRQILTTVVDVGSFREFSPDDGQPLVVGLATMDGRVIGLIADQPQIEGGAQTVISISKFTRFHRFCERFQLPLVEFNDSPAFRPGREQERSGIQGEGGKSIREEVLSTIPKIAVTLRQNYGGRYIHANLKTLGPERRGLIVKGARLGVMGAEGAVGVLMAKKLAAIKDPAQRAAAHKAAIADYEQTQLNPQQAIDLGYAEAIIEPNTLRQNLIRLLQK